MLDQLAGDAVASESPRSPWDSGRSWPWGSNLHDDRTCSRLHEYESRMPSLGLAVAWSAVAGNLHRPGQSVLAVRGGGRRGEAGDEADTTQRRSGEEGLSENAATEDGYSARPWLSLAAVYEREWRDHRIEGEDRAG